MCFFFSAEILILVEFSRVLLLHSCVLKRSMVFSCPASTLQNLGVAFLVYHRVFQRDHLDDYFILFLFCASGKDIRNKSKTNKMTLQNHQKHRKTSQHTQQYQPKQLQKQVKTSPNKNLKQNNKTRPFKPAKKTNSIYIYK